MSSQISQLPARNLNKNQLTRKLVHDYPFSSAKLSFFLHICKRMGVFFVYEVIKKRRTRNLVLKQK